MKRVEQKVEKILQKIIFGDPIKGEPLSKPTFHTYYPPNRPKENEWYKEFKVSTMDRR